MGIVLVGIASEPVSAGLYFDTVMAERPIGYWQLEDSVTGSPYGDAHDSSGQIHHGRFNNMASVTLGRPGPRPADGFFGMEDDNLSVEFAATGDGRVDLPGGFMPSGGSPRTFTGWFNATKSAEQSWFNYGPNTAGRRVSITAGQDRVAVAVSGHNFALDNLGLSAGWHHIGIALPDLPTPKSNDWIFVIDGVDRTSEASGIAGSPKTINTSDTSVRRFGQNEGGRIDEIAVFNRALSVERMQNLYNAALGTAPEPVGLTKVTDFVFQTASDNGLSPATGGLKNMPAGTELYIRERANEANPELEVRAFMEFDLTSLDPNVPVQSATLFLHESDKLNAANSANMFLAKVLEDWDPTTNTPTFGQLVDSTSEINFGNNGPASGGRTVDLDFAIDVTNFVSGWLDDPTSNYGMRLRIGDQFVAAVFDHQGANAPYLYVVQQDVQQEVPEPTTVVLLLIGVAACVPFVRRRTQRNRRDVSA